MLANSIFHREIAKLFLYVKRGKSSNYKEKCILVTMLKTNRLLENESSARETLIKEIVIIVLFYYLLLIVSCAKF